MSKITLDQIESTVLDAISQVKFNPEKAVSNLAILCLRLGFVIAQKDCHEDHTVNKD